MKNITLSADDELIEVARARARQLRYSTRLTARGVMDATALYEAPFNNLHGDGPEALFAGKKNVIEGIFDALNDMQPDILSNAEEMRRLQGPDKADGSA